MTQAVHAVGSIVWVKLTGGKWWPGEVVAQSKCPEEVTKGLRKVPLAIVKFFEEDYYEIIRSETDIHPFVCPKKNEFIRKGRERLKLDPNAEKFEKDVEKAKQICGVTEDDIDLNNSLDISVSNHFGYSPLKSKHTYGSAMVTSSAPSARSLNTSRLTSDGEYKTFEFDSGTDVRIRTQLSPAMSSRSLSYACDLCGFQTSRLANIIVHQKSHSETVKRWEPVDIGARGAFTDEKVKRKKDAMKKCSRKVLIDTNKTPKLVDKVKAKSKKQIAVVAKEQISTPLSSTTDVELSDKNSTSLTPITSSNTTAKRNSTKAKLEGTSSPKKKRKELDADSIFDKIKKQSLKKTRKRGYMGIGSLSSAMKGLSKRKDGSGGSSDEEEFLISRVPFDNNEDAVDDVEKESSLIASSDAKSDKDSKSVKVKANNENNDNKDDQYLMNSTTNILDIPLRSTSDDLMMSVRADVTSDKPGPILLDDDEDDQPESKMEEDTSDKNDEESIKADSVVEEKQTKVKIGESVIKESPEKLRELSVDQFAEKVAEVLSEDVITLPSWASTSKKSVISKTIDDDAEVSEEKTVKVVTSDQTLPGNTEKSDDKPLEADSSDEVSKKNELEENAEDKSEEKSTVFTVETKEEKSTVALEEPVIEKPVHQLTVEEPTEEPMVIEDSVEENVEEVIEEVAMEEVIVESVEEKGIQEEVLEVETTEIAEEETVEEKVEVNHQPKESTSSNEPSYVELLPMEILAEDSSVSPSPPAPSLSTSSVSFTPLVSVVPSTAPRAQPTTYVVAPASVISGPSLIPLSSGLPTVTIKTRPAFSLLNRQPPPVIPPPPLPSSPPPPPPPPPPTSPPPLPPSSVTQPQINTYDIPVPPPPVIEYSKVEQQPVMEPVYFESVESVPMMEGVDIIQVDNEQVIESSMDVFCNEIVIESDDKDCQEEYETICGETIEVCTEETVCGSDTTTSRKTGDPYSIDAMNGATLMGDNNHP